MSKRFFDLVIALVGLLTVLQPQQKQQPAQINVNINVVQPKAPSRTPILPWRRN